MKKEYYIEPELEIILFAEEDIIHTSIIDPTTDEGEGYDPFDTGNNGDIGGGYIDIDGDIDFFD